MKWSPFDRRLAIQDLFGAVARAATGDGNDSTTARPGSAVRADAAFGHAEEGALSHPESSDGHRWGQGKRAKRLPSNTIFEIAKNERRQMVLEYLASRDGPVTLGELAEHIASYENGKPIPEISPTERKRVYVGLHQCHIPKMEEAMVVTVDRQEGISLGDRAEDVLEVLAFDGQDTWYRYYGAIAFGGLALVGLSLAAGIQPMAAGLLGAYVLLVAGTALAHAWSVR